MTYILIDKAELAPRPKCGLLGWLRQWRRIAQERAQLAQMTDHELRDIGLTRLDARREADRWFWDL